MMHKKCLITATLRSAHGRVIHYVLCVMVTQVTGSADVWELYSDYHFSSEDRADHEKVREGEREGGTE